MGVRVRVREGRTVRERVWVRVSKKVTVVGEGEREGERMD